MPGGWRLGRRLVQELLIRNYAATRTRIGDLAWRARYHTRSELTREIRLWFDHGEDMLAAGGGLHVVRR